MCLAAGLRPDPMGELELSLTPSVAEAGLKTDRWGMEARTASRLGNRGKKIGGSLGGH